MVKQYQVVLDPVKLAGYGITHGQAVEAIRRANQETGGSVIEPTEAEYMVRARVICNRRRLPRHPAAHGRRRRARDAGRRRHHPDRP